MLRCECQDPSCPEHTFDYRCTNAATVHMSDDSDYSMQLCKGCCDHDRETLELINPVIEPLY